MRKWVIQLSSIKSLLFLFLENGWTLAAGISSNNFNTLKADYSEICQQLLDHSSKHSPIDIIKILTAESD